MNWFFIIMLVIAVFFLYFICRSINKNNFLLKNASVWLLFGIIWVLFSLFPKIPESIAIFLGFQVTSNFLMFFAILFLLYLVLLQSLQLSQQRKQINELIQNFSILKSEINASDKREK
ncbi:hypothetical protein BAU16_01270 [Enterococcus sp. JM9B]|nr:hypothetical protein BAU16_01270 [Enterococcus sp. JM9B]